MWRTCAKVISENSERYKGRTCRPCSDWNGYAGSLEWESCSRRVERCACLCFSKCLALLCARQGPYRNMGLQILCRLALIYFRRIHQGITSGKGSSPCCFPGLVNKHSLCRCKWLSHLFLVCTALSFLWSLRPLSSHRSNTGLATMVCAKLTRIPRVHCVCGCEISTLQVTSSTTAFLQCSMGSMGSRDLERSYVTVLWALLLYGFCFRFEVPQTCRPWLYS